MHQPPACTTCDAALDEAARIIAATTCTDCETRRIVNLTPTERQLVDAAIRDDQAEVDRVTAILDTEQAEHEARLNSPGALLASALWYAGSGLAVFPCRPGGKAPLTGHGFKDATTDLEQVRAWWTATPDANIGLPTGARFDVFDVDGPEGMLALGEYIDSGNFPVVLAKVLTPRGRHFYVPAAGQGNRAGILHQVDYRGSGGYVIAPPSRTADGRYRWILGHEINPALLAESRAA